MINILNKADVDKIYKFINNSNIVKFKNDATKISSGDRNQ